MNTTPTYTLILIGGAIFTATLCVMLYNGRRPPPCGGSDELRRRHESINERHLGRNDALSSRRGFACPMWLFFIALIIGFHLAFPLLYAIACAVFGMREPQW
jgi:hypothetical protein